MQTVRNGLSAENTYMYKQSQKLILNEARHNALLDEEAV